MWRMTEELPTRGLETTLSARDDRSVLRVEGEVDLMTAGTLADALTAAIDAASRLALDLAGVSFMDSTGLRVLLEARERAQARGVALELTVAAGGGVERLLALAGVLDLFPRSAPPGSLS
jgi:anti-anti-sigma factor